MAPAIDDDLDALIHRADLDGLIRMIDDRCSNGDWAGLLRLRDRSRAALETGRQIWPAATLAEYRLALWAPAGWAARVLAEDGGRFTIGPLTEVIAQHHTWAELADELPTGPRQAIIAAERCLRGDDLAGERFDDDPFELPLSIQPWEPSYSLATYGDDGLACDPPPSPAVSTMIAGAAIPGTRGESAVIPVEDPEIERAARQLVEPWLSSSNGRFEFAGAEGGVGAAMLALGVPLASARISPLSSMEALAWLAWAGASGGAHGRRRGAAAGRFAAWWFVATLSDLASPWPPHADDLADVLSELRWYWWDASEPATGWRLQIAVEDTVEGVSWIVNARDAAT